jgi:predicted hotdog family 3-hydroxylacyl-ACP dehydratase
MTAPDLPAISEIVPHGRPMLLLDRLVSYSGDLVTCEVQIRPDSPFMSEGGVPAIVGVEYMAQCVAAYAGLSARAKGEPVRIGFLLGSRSLRIGVDVFAPGDRLIIEARRIWGEEVLGSFACQVRRGDEILLEGNLTVYQGPMPELPT